MKKIIILIVSFFWSQLVSAQSDESFDYVKFVFSHSLRIPYHSLSIELQVVHLLDDKPIKAIVKSDPANNDKRFEYTKIDTTYFIDKVQFFKIVDILKNIPPSDIYSQGGIGFDGTTCIIIFGNSQNNISYRVWSPDSDTKKRKLEQFLIACKMIIEIVNLNPKKIL